MVAPLHRCWLWNAAAVGSTPATGHEAGGARVTALRFPDSDRSTGEPALLAVALDHGGLKVYDVVRACRRSGRSGGSTVGADHDAIASAPTVLDAAGAGAHLRSVTPDATAAPAVVRHIAWSPEQPQVLATAGDDRLVRVWDLRDAKRLVQTLEMPGGEHSDLAWSPRSAVYLAAPRRQPSGSISFMDMRVPRRLLKTFSYGTRIGTVQWTPGEELFCMAYGGVGVEMMLWPSLKSVHFHAVNEPLPGVAAVPDLAFRIHPSGRQLACGNEYGLVSVVELATLQPQYVLQRLRSPVKQLRWSAAVSTADTPGHHFLAACGALPEWDSGVEVAAVEATEGPPANTTYGAAMLPRTVQLDAPGGCIALDWHPQRPLLAYASLSDTFIRFIGSPDA